MIRNKVTGYTTLAAALIGVAVIGGCGQQDAVTAQPAPTVTVTAEPEDVTPQVCLNALDDAQALINGNADAVDLLASMEYPRALVTDDQQARDYVAKIQAQGALNQELAARWHASEVACKALSPADI